MEEQDIVDFLRAALWLGVELAAPLMVAALVVGLVVFLILVVIQFVVITKGAGRVSEVAVRFTLDALPGKQMAIDAELNAGHIDEAEAKRRRDPVAAAQRSAGALEKAASKRRSDGGRAHSFATLLAELSTIVRNECAAPGGGEDRATFAMVTTSSDTQRRALELLETIRAQTSSES